MSTRIELHPSYILHTRPYRDTSLLADVLTRDYGKISLVVKGARKAKNSQRYLLQPFISVLLSWQGKSSLKTLIGIEPQTMGSLPNVLSGTLKGHKLYSAMYANELLAYLLPQDDPSDNIFECYEQLLKQLHQSETQLEPCLRYFEFSVLDELGYGINFLNDADSDEALQGNKQYFFVPDYGFIDSENHPEMRGASFSGRELLQISEQNYTYLQTRKTAKVLSRIALKPHLRGRELKSRDLFLKVH
ncbi:MAG: DNA repair protein RecO (recombination protein O) [Candidatus Endobugula sp.]|jgi:DNA repair protein RecO (recombination protein O)